MIHCVPFLSQISWKHPEAVQMLQLSEQQASRGTPRPAASAMSAVIHSRLQQHNEPKYSDISLPNQH